MHIFGIINAFNCINNHVISCINSMLSNIAYLALAPIARELLEVCATSAPSKHVFSAGQVVVTYKRARLTTESIKTLVTIKYWLRGNNTKCYDNFYDDDADMRVAADEMV